MNVRKFFSIFFALLLCFCLPAFAFADLDDSSSSGQVAEDVSSSGSETRVEVLRVSASDTSGLHALVLSLLGDYNPVVKDYTYYTTGYNGSQTLNHSIDISPDYSWLATALLFIVVLFCVFRLIGAIFSGKI